MKKSCPIIEEESEYVFSYSFIIFLRGFDAMKKESQFQSDLIKEIKGRFPGCIVMKNDANYIQGIPDLLVLFENKWASLECKRSEKEKHRPNQDYYVEKMNNMSFSAFVYPENKEEVLNDLGRSFERHS